LQDILKEIQTKHRAVTAIPEMERLRPLYQTISPFSQITVFEWLENRIKEGTVESLEPRCGSIPPMLV